jgi:hypothetical protein
MVTCAGGCVLLGTAFLDFSRLPSRAGNLQQAQQCWQAVVLVGSTLEWVLVVARPPGVTQLTCSQHHMALPAD